ncbi:MAG: hypothetical protein HYX75_25175 [Acidobacteria bacterium]|nr:hypothetical protein [Acidobacteriota bacterium]
MTWLSVGKGTLVALIYLPRAGQSHLVAPEPPQFCLLIVAIAMACMPLGRDHVAAPGRLGWSLVIVGTLSFGIYSIVVDPLQREGPPAVQRSAIGEEYLDMADWIRENTLAGCVVHINDAPAFRALTLRPMTHSRSDITRALHGGHDPREISDRIERLQQAALDPTRLLSVATAAGADYIVLPANVHYELRLLKVFANKGYVVYRNNADPPA